MGILNLDSCKHSLIGKDICRWTVKKSSLSLPWHKSHVKIVIKVRKDSHSKEVKPTPNMAGGECTPFTQPPATLHTEGPAGGEWVQLTQWHSTSVGWAWVRHPFKRCLCFVLAFGGQSNRIGTVQDRVSRFMASIPFHRSVNMLLCILKHKQH